MLEFSQIHDLRTKQSRATYFLQCLHTSRIITCTAFFSASSSGYVLGIIMMMPHWKYKTVRVYSKDVCGSRSELYLQVWPVA